MRGHYPPDEMSSDFKRPQIELEDAIPKPNLSSVESKDPSLEGGFKVIYNKEVPLDIKIESNEGTKDLASFEPIRCKLLSDAINQEGIPTRVKLEISWESDLHFHYTNIVDEQTFLDMKKKQDIKIDFPQYCNLIVKICDNCIKIPDTYIGLFTIKEEGTSKLVFIKGSDFKFRELLLLDFKKTPDEIIQKHIL